MSVWVSPITGILGRGSSPSSFSIPIRSSCWTSLVASVGVGSFLLSEEGRHYFVLGRFSLPRESAHSVRSLKVVFCSQFLDCRESIVFVIVQQVSIRALFASSRCRGFVGVSGRRNETGEARGATRGDSTRELLTWYATDRVCPEFHLKLLCFSALFRDITTNHLLVCVLSLVRAER